MAAAAQPMSELPDTGLHIPAGGGVVLCGRGFLGADGVYHRRPSACWARPHACIPSWGAASPISSKPWGTGYGVPGWLDGARGERELELELGPDWVRRPGWLASHSPHACNTRWEAFCYQFHDPEWRFVCTCCAQSRARDNECLHFRGTLRRRCARKADFLSGGGPWPPTLYPLRSEGADGTGAACCVLGQL